MEIRIWIKVTSASATSRRRMQRSHAGPQCISEMTQKVDLDLFILIISKWFFYHLYFLIHYSSWKRTSGMLLMTLNNLNMISSLKTVITKSRALLDNVVFLYCLACHLRQALKCSGDLQFKYKISIDRCVHCSDWYWYFQLG